MKACEAQSLYHYYVYNLVQNLAQSIQKDWFIKDVQKLKAQQDLLQEITSKLPVYLPIELGLF